MCLAMLSFYVGTWVLFFVVSHDTAGMFRETGSFPKVESGPNTRGINVNVVELCLIVITLVLFVRSCTM